MTSARKCLLTATMVSVAGAIAVLPARAADLPVKAPIYKAPVYQAPIAFNWTGCYIGAQGGYAWGRTSYDLDIPPTPGSGFPFDLRGGVAGGHLGCNYQVQRFVLGIEGDGEWTNLKGDDGGQGGTVDRIEAQWQASIRARLGYAFGPTMIYATGGGAWMNVDYSRPNFDSLVINKTLSGWTVGGGVEHYFRPNWSGRIEYRFARFDSDSFPFSTGTQRTLNATETNTVRVGISYKFR